MSNSGGAEKIPVSTILLDKFLKITGTEAIGNYTAYQFLINGLNDFLVPYHDSLYIRNIQTINALYLEAVEKRRGVFHLDPNILLELDYNKYRMIYREMIALCSRKGIYPEEVESEYVGSRTVAATEAAG